MGGCLGACSAGRSWGCPVASCASKAVANCMMLSTFHAASAFSSWMASHTCNAGEAWDEADERQHNAVAQRVRISTARADVLCWEPSE